MAIDHPAVHARTLIPEAAFDHPAVHPRAASPAAEPLDDCDSPSMLELEAARLPEVCLLQYCRSDQIEQLLHGRVGSILRKERETETRLTEIMDTLQVQRETPIREESSTSVGVTSDGARLQLPALGMGLQRQQSFLPGSMLTEREQCAVRARRESCVQHLARLAGRAIGKTIRKPCRTSGARTSQPPSGR